MGIKKLASGLLHVIFGNDFFYNNSKWIGDSLVGCESILDLGCGKASPYVRYFHKNYHYATGVDLFFEVCEAAKSTKRYSAIVQSDALSYLRKCSNRQFDVIMALDIIEHLPKPESAELLVEMERVAKKVIVVVTPNGYWPALLAGDGMAHLCGWFYSEMISRGYIIRGAGGWALLRNRKTSFLWWCDLTSVAFQILIFNISQVFVKSRPWHAYGITCIKVRSLQ